jgi:hypothetical protein
MGCTPGAAVAPEGASGTDSGMEFVRKYTTAIALEASQYALRNNVLCQQLASLNRSWFYDQSAWHWQRGRFIGAADVTLLLYY